MLITVRKSLSDAIRRYPTVGASIGLSLRGPDSLSDAIRRYPTVTLDAPRPPSSFPRLPVLPVEQEGVNRLAQETMITLIIGSVSS